MVALPLGLGIALASDLPAMSGVIAAIVGGLITTFFRGSHVGINGPTAGLIAVTLSSLGTLNDGSGNQLNYVLAAFVVAGGIQTLMGLLKLGRIANLFHSTVVQGILAAIGVIIFAKQIHLALGVENTASGIIPTLIDSVKSLPNINPAVGAISLMGLFLLIFQSKINYKLFHIIPPPMWVMLLAIPLAYLFNFFDPHSFHFFGNQYELGPSLLINIPDNPLDAIIYPNFSRIGDMEFWISVVAISLIATIETLASSKAVDKLDPYKRRTDLNKDLMAVGISSMVSGAIGGLPIINVIVRSTVNVHNGGKTRWANFYHGALLIAFIFMLAPVIQQVPLAALAILLVYTGYKLASPKVFKRVYSEGIEQLIIFSFTLIITLFTNLLVGIFAGLLLALLTHFLLAKVPASQFFYQIFNSGSSLIIHKEGSYELRLKGVVNFLSTLRLDGFLEQIPSERVVKINFSNARLVDFSIMERIYDFKDSYEDKAGSVELIGLDEHVSSSDHIQALKLLTSLPLQENTRQKNLHEMADENGWTFNAQRSRDIKEFKGFYFFKTRPIVSKQTSIHCIKNGTKWEISDVDFEEGALEATEEFHCTLGMLHLQGSIPKFTIEKKGFMDRYRIAHKDIDYELFEGLSSNYIVKVEDSGAMENWLTDDISRLIEASNLHHLESNGQAILVFTEKLRLANIKEYAQIIRFMDDFKGLLVKD